MNGRQFSFSSLADQLLTFASRHGPELGGPFCLESIYRRMINGMAAFLKTCLATWHVQQCLALVLGSCLPGRLHHTPPDDNSEIMALMQH